MRKLVVIIFSALIAVTHQVAMSAEIRAEDFNAIPHVRQFSGNLIVKPCMMPVIASAARSVLERLATYQIDELDLWRVPVPKGQTEFNYARQLMATGLFECIQPDWTEFACRVPNDDSYYLQWHHVTMESPLAWNIITGAAESDPLMIIAIVDSGVNAVPDLAGRMVLGYNSKDHRAQANGGLVEDVCTTSVNGHGTFVAGCAAASGDNHTGVAGMGWNFKIMPIRVTNNPGSIGNDVPHAALDKFDGILWAASHGAKIINVSLTGVDDPMVESVGNTIRQTYDAIIVWAAGNEHAPIATNPANAIVVGATDQNDVLWSGSNYGAGIDCVAPGVGIYSTNKFGYVTSGTGTSFATPLVSGCLALIWSLNRALSAEAIESFLYVGCRDIGTVGEDIYFGAGRINSYRSILGTRLFHVRELGTIAAFPTTSASYMNVASQVVGYGTNATRYGAMRWSGGTIAEIPFPAGFNGARALCINRMGAVTGTTYHSIGGDKNNWLDSRAFYWAGGSMQLLMQPPGKQFAQAVFIADNGNILVYVGPDIGTFFYSSKDDLNPIQLPVPPQYDFGSGTRISSTGIITGYVHDPNSTFNDGYKPCYWTSPTSTPIVFTENNNLIPTGIHSVNGSGTFVGEGGTLATGSRFPIAIRNGEITQLPMVPGSFAQGVNHINESGAMVGIFVTSTPGSQHHACLWLNNTPFDLMDLRASDSGLWTLRDPEMINESGEILGTGVINGNTRAFIAVPEFPGGSSGLTVNCSVVLGDYEGGDDTLVPVTFEFSRTLTNELEGTYVEMKDPAAGTYRIEPNPELRGQYSVRATAPHWLSKRVEDVIISDSSTIGADFVLVNGDVEQDNEVNLVDFGALAVAFGSIDGDSNWNPNADLDGDGEVNLVDFGIFSESFGMAGDD